MPPPIIAQIKTLQRVGIFTDYRHPAEVPDCKRYNLVYGFNGAGKTTLARLLGSLDGGGPGAAMPPEARFQFSLTDGRAIRRDENIDALTRRILVFNVDFINENLRWGDGRANPVFYIGKDASRRAELLERVERRIPLRDEQRRSADIERTAKDRALATFYTDTSRIIAEMLNLGRQYDARHLKQDYDSGAGGGGIRLCRKTNARTEGT
jgi:wobble nucleotide-excising tRNase